MAGYVRNDTPNNIADGNIINASDLDGEFDKLQTAFGAASGHNHSGSAGDGKPIESVGPAQDLVVSATAATPKTNNTLDVGATSFKFKDGFFAGKVDTGTITLGGTNVTSSAAELNILDGVTATTAELNKLAGATVSTTELNYVTGVTSAIQTQLGTKQATITGAASTVVSSNLTADFAMVSDAAGKVAVHPTVTSTELGYLDGVTSAIQTQIGTKQATLTGAATTIASSDLTASRALASNASGKVVVSAVTDTELGYVSGVTSAIQTQIDTKAPLASPTFTGQASFADGTAAAPSIAHTGDLNAGLFFPAADTVAVATSSTERLRITASGLVGIGTTPAKLFHVYRDNTDQDAQVQIEQDGSGSPVLGFLKTGVSAWLTGLYNSDDSYRIASSTTDLNTNPRLVITTSGNVGIGTTSPGQLLNLYNATSAVLQINGDATTSIVLDRASTDTSGPVLGWRKRRGTTASPLAVVSGDATGTINYAAYDGSALQVTSQIINSVGTFTGVNDVSGFMTFCTRPTGAAAASTERMRIDASGNVGIGTSSPSTKLDVSGTVNATALSIGGTAITATAAELNFVDGVTSLIQTQLDAKIDVDYQVFTASGTWTKPAGISANAVVYFHVIGAGSSGCAYFRGSGTLRYVNGGQGGGGFIASVLASSLGATVSVTVGAGGAARTASGSSTVTAGAIGGVSSFGSYGPSAATSGPGATSTANDPLYYYHGFDGHVGGDSSSDSSLQENVDSVYGGGAGSSLVGSTVLTPGTSVSGGAGGAGATGTSAVATAGSAPGGGGGAAQSTSTSTSGTVTSGAGARGEVRVWTIG